MSKKTFILLIIILALAGITTYVLFSLWKTPPVKTGEESTGTNFISQFNPFGTPTKTNTAPPTDVSEYQAPGGEIATSKLIKVSSMPVAGYIEYSKERVAEVGTEFVPSLRYIEKATGNIYQTFADKIFEQKFSGTTIPKIYDAYFGNKGESVAMRYLKADNKTIETFVGTLPKELLGADPNAVNELKGSFLPNNVKDISISPDGTKIFYLFESGNNVIGTTLDFLTNKKVQIFDSPFTEWLSQWGSNKMISLTTKPSANVAGYMYRIDDTGKSINKILGNISGLTTLASPDGKSILYSDNNLNLSIYNTDARNSNTLGVKTMAEKCVWGKISDVVYCSVPKNIGANNYPDSWYQGEASFDDQLWKIDTKTGNADLILDPSTLTIEKIDGIKLSLDEGENYLFFVNKKDSFLWEFSLK